MYNKYFDLTRLISSTLTFAAPASLWATALLAALVLAAVGLFFGGVVAGSLYAGGFGFCEVFGFDGCCGGFPTLFVGFGFPIIFGSFGFGASANTTPDDEATSIVSLLL